MAMSVATPITRRGRDRSDTIDKAFAVFLGLYPFLCIYRFVSGLTIGDALLLLFFLRAIGRSVGKDGRTIAVLLFASFILLGFVKCILFNPAVVDGQLMSMVVRWVRVTFYLFAALLLGRNMAHRELFLKTLVIFSVIATAFLVFQYIAFYGAGSVVLGRIPGLQIYVEDYAEIDYETTYSYVFRPCSFFLEPASFVQYVVVALCALLFTKTFNKRLRVVLSVIITAGAIMTTSGQGILYIALVYAIWFFLTTRKKAYCVLMLAGILVLIPALYSSVEPFQYAVNRLFVSEGASDARLGSYELLLEIGSVGDLLFGQGFGYVPEGEWFSGAMYVLHGTGLVGFGFACAMFYQLFHKAHEVMPRVVCVIFFVMFFGTALFYNYMLFWYFATVIAFSEVREKETSKAHPHRAAPIVRLRRVL